MTLPVLIWLATSIAGLVLALAGIRDAWLDLGALADIPRNGRWMIARHQLIRYTLRAVICAAFVAAVFAPAYIVELLIGANVALLLIGASEYATAAFLRRDVRARAIAAQREETGQ